MRALPAAGFVPVATRELRWILRDKAALFLILGVPLIAFVILGVIFENAAIRHLDVILVDADRSPTSLLVVQRIAAAPGIRLSERAGDLTAAAQAIRAGTVIAAVHIPANFGRDLAAGHRPTIALFYDNRLMIAGSSASQSLQDALRDAIGAVMPPQQSLSGAAGPLVVTQYVPADPMRNQAQRLLRMVLPAILHMVIAMAAAYAAGSEFSRRSLRAWLRCAGDSPLTALVGKLALLFPIFIALLAALDLVLHGVLGIPFDGDPVMAALATGLLVAACLGLGAFLALLMRDLPFGLGLTALLCALAFEGAGLPVTGLSPFARIESTLLPLRWYIRILSDQAVQGAPTAGSAVAFAALAGLTFLYGGLAWWRLTRLAAGPSRAVAMRRSPPRLPSRPESAGGAFVGEIRRIFTDRGVMSLMILAPILFGFFFSFPYLGQTLRELPLAVVDQDRTELSRQIVMTLDADDGLSVTERPETLAEAQAALRDRKIFGVVEIPAGTTRGLLKGEAAPLPSYVDPAYPLVYRRMLQGIDEAVSALTDGLTSHEVRAGGVADRLLAPTSPAVILPVPLFNPTGGPVGAILPAVLLLIFQQTLLMGAAMSAGTAFAPIFAPGAVPTRSSASRIVAQGLAHLVVSLPVLLLLLILLASVCGFAIAGRLPDLILFAVPFLLATSFMGQATGIWIRPREITAVLILALSLPPLFLIGVAWPAEAIPPSLRTIGLLFPSGRGIDGLLRIVQMGAALPDLSIDWLTVLALVPHYLLLAVSGMALRPGRAAHAR
jgi:ABC-2 type transport system permease protein